MSLTCRVQIVLGSVPAQKAEAIRRALEPDNVGFPEGLSLGIENVDNKLVFNFRGERDMGHLIGSVDEVLEHVQVALGVMK